MGGQGGQQKRIHNFFGAGAYALSVGWLVRPIPSSPQNMHAHAKLYSARRYTPVQSAWPNSNAKIVVGFVVVVVCKQPTIELDAVRPRGQNGPDNNTYLDSGGKTLVFSVDEVFS